MNHPMKKRHSSTITLAPPARKLRKSCSLATCTSPPGTCMHCTCDGRCGRHVSGRCGGRREGSGRGCKRDGCSHDEKCLHSNRATCCHCRNLVSSSGRAAKRPRVTSMAPPVHLQMLSSPVYNQQMATSAAPDGQEPPMTMSDEVLEAELHAFLQDANLGDELALCEYQEWTSRRQYCNLIVLVCGMQFNLHKHPMLLESVKLHRMANEREKMEVNTLAGVVPVLELSVFPGGAEMFEILAIYCYTGEINFSPSTFAHMHCAIEFLELREEIRQSARRFLAHHSSHPTKGVSHLVQIIHAAQTLAQTQPEQVAFHSAGATLIESCMCALVDKRETLDTDAMCEIFTLPNDLLVNFIQRAMASKPFASSTTAKSVHELCEQAKLAQFHQDAYESSSPSQYSREIAEQCVRMLQVHSLEIDSIKTHNVTMCEDELIDLSVLLTNDNPDKMCIKLMPDDELFPSSPSPVDVANFSTSDSFGFGVFTCTLPETFVI